MATTQVTEEAMIAASMSLFISDQGMLNAGISSVVYSNAVGATEGTLNLINADTVTDEKLRAELKEEEEKNQDAFEAAADMAKAVMEEHLERLSDPVSYANGQFNIGGILVDEEDMDATVDDMVDDFDAVVAKHDLDAEQAASLYALLLAYQNTDDPHAKAQILEDIKTQLPEDVAVDMAREANKRKTVSQERDVTVEEIRVAENAAPTTYDESPFGDTDSPSDQFNASADGGVAPAQVGQEPVAPSNAPSSPLTLDA